MEVSIKHGQEIEYTHWRVGWRLQSWALQGRLWKREGGGEEQGEYGLAGKIQFLREETGSEKLPILC